VAIIKKAGLGKGFDALIPQDFDKSIILDDQERIQKLLISDISPNPDQPRSSFDPEALEQLAQSIKNHGVIQPLVVTTAGAAPGKYILIAGERRLRASDMAGLQKVPAVVRSTQELERLEIALIENVQREDLSPLDQAVSIERLHQQFNMSYGKISERLGKAWQGFVYGQ
jgi:ParB family transcriptional regulator, chromosome partitioning protein